MVRESLGTPVFNSNV